jgi:hypothetical protein
MEKESGNGLMEMYTKALGKMIKCMEKVYFNRQMVGYTKVNS